MGFRMHRQSPDARRKRHQYYMRHRTQERARAKKRYHQYKHNPAYRRKRQLYERNPQQHHLLTSPRSASSVNPDTVSIPFLYGPELKEGLVVGFPGEGHLTCILGGEIREVSMVGALRNFLFLSDNDIDTLDLMASPQEKQARERGSFAPPGQRGGRDGQPQHVQLPSKKRQDARRYKSNPKNKRDSRNYYHLVCKIDPNCMQRRENYREHPDKYKRRRAPLRDASSKFASLLREILQDEGLFPDTCEFPAP